MNENDKLKSILEEILEVVTQIEKRTVEKPSDNYIITPIKKQLINLKYRIKKL